MKGINDQYGYRLLMEVCWIYMNPRDRKCNHYETDIDQPFEKEKMKKRKQKYYYDLVVYVMNE